MEIRGTLVNIDGHTGGDPGPAPAAAPLRIEIHPPYGRGSGSTFARRLTVRNLDGAADLRVAFVGSSAYVRIPFGEERNFDGVITEFTVQSSAGDIEWEATAVVAA